MRKFFWLLITLALAVGFLIGDYIAKHFADAHGIKKGWGVFTNSRESG